MSNYGDGGVFARRTISCGSAPCSAPGSPKSRVKFLCSHGGKILPRPSDGQLKYVGGETRVISVPRDISFQELMKRLTYLIDGEMILKYQLATEDLDALVTVKSEEDLVHMFDEMEHYQMMGFPRMRTFLFPVNHIMMDEQLPFDQRYIFSINGIVSTTRHVSPARHHPNSNPNFNPSKHLRSVASSTCTSPRSPDSCTAECFNSEMWPHTNNHHNMHKIQSSPSICNLINNIQQHSNHYSHQQQLPSPQYYHNSTPPHHTHSGYRSPNPVLDKSRSSNAVRSGARGDGPRFQLDSLSPNSYYYSSRDHNRGGTECCTTAGHFSDRRLIDRQETLP